MESVISRTLPPGEAHLAALAAAMLLAAATADCAARSGENRVESSAAAKSADTPIAVDKLPGIATVDERYQSYNIEMAEPTGGQFWKPYEKMGSKSQAGASSSQAQGAEFYANLKEA